VVWKLQGSIELERKRSGKWKSRAGKVYYIWRKECGSKREDRKEQEGRSILSAL